MPLKSSRSDTLLVLVDQAVVSGGNFLTTLVLARVLVPSSYGRFSLLLMFLYAINTCHSSLVIYPLILRVAKCAPEKVSNATTSGLLQTLFLAAPLALGCLAFAVIAHQIQALLFMILAMIAWQLQETTRRALLSTHNAAKAILPDACCYIGQAAMLFVLQPHGLNVILCAIVLTSSIAMAWQMVALRMMPKDVPTRRALIDDARQSWTLGRHILGGNGFNMLALQTPGWVLAYFAGPVGVAGYQAILNLAGISNPIIFSVNTSLIPTVARSAHQGYAVARKTALRVGLQYGALLLPCFLALGFFPHQVMRMLYGSGNPYLQFATLLPLFIGAYAIQYVATVIGAYEGGMSRPQTYFYVQAISTVALIALALPLVQQYGVKGAVIAVFGFSLFRLASFATFSAVADRQPKSLPRAERSTHGISQPAIKQSVAVCVLTYRRDSLLRNTVASLQQQTLLNDDRWQMSVVIVDNDGLRSAQPSVDDARSNSRFPIAYVCNPANGLSTGRNLAISAAGDCDYIAFIDDDEVASPSWLAELVLASETHSSDVVTGPVHPVLKNAPDWIERGKYFSPAVHPTGTAITHIASNNTLIRRNVLTRFRFDDRFDTTGGEDTDFFLRVCSAGHTATWCQEAVVHESTLR